MIITELENADLYIDAVYGGSRLGHSGDDPLPKLLGVDNQAGFRVLGRRKLLEKIKLIVLITSFKNAEWPDNLDPETGLFTYYGDRHEPGELHNTPRDGNLILKNLFDAAHANHNRIPPILVFGKADAYRDMQFLGLAVPGADGMGPDEDLVAVWRIKNNLRFQNYKATFTILDVPEIKRCWIEEIRLGNAWDSCHAPRAWLQWQNSRAFAALKSMPIRKIRSKSDQLPSDSREKSILKVLLDSYSNRPIDFERCAMEIAKMMLPQIYREELTRPWRDGGRDATGLYKVGHGFASIDVDFSLEAKRYDLDHGVGVKDVSRLISRLRHRQFGILVTTSYVSAQAYAEIISDNHPVLVISGADVTRILKSKFHDQQALKNWVESLKPDT